VAIIKLNNATEITDLDLNNDYQTEALGYAVADDCVVVVKDSVPEPRLQEILNTWGQPSRELIHTYILEKKLTGRHWRKHLVNLSYITKPYKDRFKENVHYSRVSFDRDEKTNKPLGLFTSGELDWHSDQQANHQSQKVIALMSLYGTKNSQTTFLCTAEAYDKLNHDDKSAVDQLVSVYKWDDGSMCDDLDPDQKEIIRYNQVPLDGMESPLKDQTASGKEGIKFPSHSFSHFRGLSAIQSQQYKQHLWEKINKPEYIYTHNWEDGQIVFMDQVITLHARPTNVQQGNKRTLVRMCSYMDKLFPETGKPRDKVLWEGNYITEDEFAAKVDSVRRVEQQ
jgi:alpha-ketoglutarate-dependent taurine dioxygenase